MFTAKKIGENSQDPGKTDETASKNLIKSSSSIIDYLSVAGFEQESDQWLKELHQPTVNDSLFFLCKKA